MRRHPPGSNGLSNGSVATVPVDTFGRFGVGVGEDGQEARLKKMGFDDAEIVKIMDVSGNSPASTEGSTSNGVSSASEAVPTADSADGSVGNGGDAEATRTDDAVDDDAGEAAVPGLKGAPSAVAAPDNGTAGRVLGSDGDNRGLDTLLGDFAESVRQNPVVVDGGLSAAASPASANGDTNSSATSKRRDLLASLRAALPGKSHSASAAAASSLNAKAVFDGLVAYDPAATGDPEVAAAKRFGGEVVSFLQSEVEAPLLAMCGDADFQAVIPASAALPADVVLSDAEDAPTIPHNLERLQDSSLLAAMTTLKFYPSMLQLFLQGGDKLDAAEANISAFFAKFFGDLIATPYTSTDLRMLVMNLQVAMVETFKLLKLIDENSPTLSEGENRDVAYLVALVEGLTRLSARDIPVEAFPVIDTILQDIFSIKHEGLKDAIVERLVAIAVNEDESPEVRLAVVMSISFDAIRVSLTNEHKRQLSGIALQSASVESLLSDLRTLDMQDPRSKRSFLQKNLFLRMTRLEYFISDVLFPKFGVGAEDRIFVAFLLFYSACEFKDSDLFKQL